MQPFIQSFFLLVSILSFSTAGPSKWSHCFPHCGGKKQSPINFKAPSLQYNSRLPGSLSFKGYAATYWYVFIFELKNNGHTLVVDVKEPLACIDLKEIGTFQLQQFYFHWGSENYMGSEHQFNGRSFPAELHLVHYNANYSSVEEAMDKPNGLAVLGVFITVGRSNSAFDLFLSYVKNGRVIKSGQSSPMPGFVIQNLLPSDTDDFMRYQGSLTTPPCYETVTWTVFRTPIEISQDQLDTFRLLKDSHGDPLADNFRPVQPVNERTIQASFQFPSFR